MQTQTQIELVDMDDKVKIIYKDEDTKEGRTHSYTYNKINGIFYPMFCDKQRWEFLNKTITYNPSDIIIATYPKCGTTWLEQIVILMKYGLQNKDKLNPAVRNSYDFENQIGKIHIEGSVEQPNMNLFESKEMSFISLEAFNNIPFRIIKTHSPPSLLIAKDQLFQQKNKIIIISRNPLDATVSGYFHYNALRAFYKKNTDPNSPYVPIQFKQWSRLWLRGLVAFGSWFDWNNEWLKQYQTNSSHVHFLTYENLKQNTLEELKKINTFLETNLSDDQLKEIRELTRFEKMKTEAQKNIVDDINSDIHLRRGIVGDWKNYFEDDMVESYRNKLTDYELLNALYGGFGK